MESARTARTLKTLSDPGLYEVVFRTMPVGMAICNKESRVVQANQAWLDLFRSSEEEMIGRTSLEITHADDLEKTRETITSLRSGETDRVHLEKRYVRDDGSYFWADMTASRLNDAEGRVASVLIVLNDISGKKILENELRERSVTKGMILNALSDNVILHDATMGIVWSNRAARDNLPRNENSMPPRACYEVWWNEDAPCPGCPVQEAMDVKEFRKAEITGHDGRIWLVKAFPVLADDGSVLGAVEVTGDITESKLAEKAMDEARALAEQASKTKTEFIANISHELRSPMNAVLGMLDLLLDTNLDEEQKDFAMTALKAGEGLLAIINDLLDFTKLQAKNLTLSKIPFDPRPILIVLEDLFRRQYRGKDVVLRVSTDQSVPDRVYSDEGRFRQILINLIGNAMKFTRQGEVNVHLSFLQGPGEGHRPRLLFSVSDTGIGMESAEVSSVFEPFFQLNWGRSRKYEGTGLGMGIVKRLTELMGGSMCIGSEPGKGTDVHFILPVELS